MYKEDGKLRTESSSITKTLVCSTCHHDSIIETSGLINYKCIRCGGVLIEKKESK